MSDNQPQYIVPRAEALRFVQACLEEAGACREHAETQAQLLVDADYRGHYSHGVNRLEVYVMELKHGPSGCVGQGQPTVLNSHGATAWVDGGNRMGGVVGKFAMELAIEKAKEFGIGFVTVKGSNHFGFAGFYSKLALDQGVIGFSMTNANPCSFPCRSASLAYGSNPIAMFAPGDHDSFELDMATATVAIGKVEIADRMGEKTIPAGWAADCRGVPTTDPKKVLGVGGGPLPLGGAEETSGYKGTGLAVMIEILTAVMSGASYGPNVRRFKHPEEGPANIGHCFMALDPKVFVPDFEGRLSNLLDTFRNLPSVDSEKPVLIAGDKAKEHIKHCDLHGGIPYHKNQIDYLHGWSQQLGVPMVSFKEHNPPQ